MTEKEETDAYYYYQMVSMGYTRQEAYNIRKGLNADGSEPEPELPF